MASNNPKTPLAAAVEAAQEFKLLLDIQPVDKLFWPRHLGGNLFRSATYHRATALLAQASAQCLQSPNSGGFQHLYVLPVVDIVSNDRTDVPANQLELFARVTAGVAQLVIQVLEERGRGGEHSGFLEIGVRFHGKAEQSVEQVKGERDAVHASVPERVVGTTFCHDGAACSTEGGA
jgi:hypothetical protein